MNCKHGYFIQNIELFRDKNKPVSRREACMNKEDSMFADGNLEVGVGENGAGRKYQKCEIEDDLLGMNYAWGG